jgi:hypothetical protein
MSKIALSPPASGTATFTLSAPATNTDRTLSLPDTTAPILAGSGITLSASAPANTLVTTDAGNVGIGTSSPTGKLQVRSANPQVWMEDSAGGTNGKFTAIGTSNGNMTFSRYLDNGTLVGEFARIDSSGNLLVNTTSNLNASHQIWKNNPNGIVASLQNSNSTNGFVLDLVSQSASGTSFSLIRGYVAGGTQVFAVQGNGNVVNTNNSYGPLSDIKLKENIVDATPKLEKLMQVRIVNYNLKIDPELKQIGVIAQELEQVFPGLVDEHPDRDADGNDLGTTTKSVKMSVFVPMLVKAIQELNAKVDAQAAEIAALKGQA